MNDADDPTDRTGSTRLSVTEERLTVQVEEQEVGTVRVRTVTHKELREIPVVLHNKAVRIERVPMHRLVDVEFETRQEGNTTIVPVFEYVPVTEMKLMLKEEIRITTIVTEDSSVICIGINRSSRDQLWARANFSWRK
jgi:stress response protein YsnF